VRPAWTIAVLAVLVGLLPAVRAASQGAAAACPGAAMVIPTDGKVGWSYRWPTGVLGLHTGVDVFGARGDPVYAVEGGPVLSADDRRVRIRHAALAVDSYYTHLDRVHVRSGQRVARGQLIGEKGDKGADGIVHLHFSLTRVPPGAADWLWLDEREIANTVDPSPYLGANVNYATGATDHGRRTIVERCAAPRLDKRSFIPIGPRRSRP
jgi:murein DD-endopeptidase MepM/ murein hydrolase activator NlpD